MTLQKRSVTAPSSISPGGDITVTSNGSIVSGDLMFAWFSAPGDDFRINSVIDGWHEWGQARTTDAEHLIVFYRVSGGSEPSTYATAFGGTVIGGLFVVYSDASAHVAIDSLARDIRASSSNIVFPTVTFSTGGMLVNLATLDSVFSVDPPVGSTEEADGPVSTTGRLYLMRETVSSGATGTRTGDSGVSESAEVLSIALIDAVFSYPFGVVYRDRSVITQQGSVTTFDIASPTNLKVGDTMILHIGFQTSSPTISVSNGGGNSWALVDQVTGDNSVHVYSKVAVAADISTTYTVSWSGSKTAIASITCYYSPTGNTVIVGTPVHQTNSSQTNLPLPTLTTPYDNALVITLVSNDSSVTSSWDTSNSRGLRHYDVGSNIVIHGYTEFTPSAGSLGIRTPTLLGISNNSKVVSLALNEQLLPTDPNSLTATKNGSSQIDLTWADNSNNETGFEVERSANGTTGWSNITTTSANATSYSNTGLSENATWYYRIRAVNLAGNSAYSSVSNATTDIAAPTSLSAVQNGSTQIDLSWTDNSSVESGYKIEQSPNGSTGWTVINTTSPNVHTYSVTGLTQNTTYYFRVRAYVSSTFSSYSNTASETTGVASPTALTALPKLSTKITLSWTDNGSGEDGFKIERSSNGISGWSQIATVGSNVTTYDNTGLSANTTYYYRVRTYKGSVNSDYTNVANATTYHTLTIPTLLTAVPISSTSVRLTWSDLDTGVTGYRIERDNVEIDTISSPPYVDVTVDEKTTYTYRIRAYRSGSIEYSSYSDTISITTPITIREVKDTKLFLLSPATVFTSQVLMPTVTYPLDSIAYDISSVTGDIADIRLGMTICFGSAPSLYDLGRSRIRKSPIDGTLYIGRSARGSHDGEVNLSSGVYITVLDDYRVWAKIPYITPAGITYKDSDIAVLDNTSKPPPISNCGPSAIDYVNNGTSKFRVGFNSTSQTVAVGATLSTYLWDIADGSVHSGSISTDTVVVDFPIGVRWIHLTVTDSNGKSHTSHALIVALDPIPANDLSFSNFMITSHSIKENGQSVDLLVRSEIDESVYPDGTLIMLWSGSPSTVDSRDNVLFIGWHTSDPSEIAGSNLGTLTDTTLHCIDVLGRLDLLVGFTQILEHKTSPTAWEEYKNPTVDTLIHYAIYWQSSALELADFTLPNTGTDYKFCALGCDGNSIYEQMKQLADSYVPDKVFVCNKLGQLSVRSDPMYQEVSDRTSSVQCTLNPSDYTSLHYTVNHVPRLNLLGGYAFLAIDSAVVSMFCHAPGSTVGQGTEQQDHNSQVAKSQDDLNAVTGHRYAKLNAKYSPFSITLSTSDDLDIDPSLMLWVNLNLTDSIKASRGLVLTNARGLVREMSIRYNYGRTGNTRTIELTWEIETVGYPGLTETLSTVKPITDGGWTPEPIIPPGLPIGVPSGVEKMAMIDNHMVIISTDDFQSSPPTWSKFEGLFTDTSVDNFSAHNLYSCIVDPFSPLYRSLGSTVRAFAVNSIGIWRIDDIFGVDGDPVKTLLYTFTETTFMKHRTIMASFGRYFSSESDNPWLAVTSYYHNGFLPAPDKTTCIFSKDAGQTWSVENVISTDRDTNYSTENNYYPGLWLSPRTPGLAYSVAWHLISDDPELTEGRGYKSTDWGETWTLIPDMFVGQFLGGAIHVPYEDNSDEAIIYNGVGASEPLDFTVTSIGTSAISPNVGDIDYGIRRYPFALRTYDGDRLKVVLAGHGDHSDDHEAFSTDLKSGVFISLDGGETWSTLILPMDANVNDTYPDQAAFSGDSADVIYIWGNQFYIAQSVSGSVEDKYGNIGGLVSGEEEVVLLCGGE